MDYPFPTFTRQTVTLPGETIPEIVERHYASQCRRQDTAVIVDESAWKVILWDYLAPQESQTVVPFASGVLAARSAERVRANRERHREFLARQSEDLEDIV